LYAAVAFCASPSFTSPSALFLRSLIAGSSDATTLAALNLTESSIPFTSAATAGVLDFDVVFVVVFAGGFTGAVTGAFTSGSSEVFGVATFGVSSSVTGFVAFGRGRRFTVGVGVGATVGLGIGVGVGRGPKKRLKNEGFSAAGVVTAGFGVGAGTMRPRVVVPSPFTKGRAMDVTRRTTISLRMGLVGNWRQIVFYERLLSSLSSKSGQNEPQAMLRSWVEVDLGAIQRNLAVLKSLGAPGLKFMAVIKANAYGHGAVEVARALAGRIDMFGVANLTEAHEISAEARGTPICLLSGTLPAEHGEVARRGYIPAVSTFEEAALYASHAAGGRVKIHLVVDTGMGRLGVWQEETIETARRILALPGIEVTGISSHFPVADEDPAFTAEQLARFHSVVEKLRFIGLGDALVHIENSAGLIQFPAQAGSLVRPGLALYSASPLPSFQARLERALTWKTRVLLVRDFSAGRSVSYGRTFITPRPMKVATLAVGYADGYPRQVSGRGASVLIAGKRCPVLGRVTMDQIMVDVSGLEVESGAEAVLLGAQGEERITATELASLAGTIPWDIFTGIGPRVTRLHVT